MRAIVMWLARAKPEVASAQVVLAVALGGVAFGSIFVRLAHAPALAIAAWRLGFASLAVLPLHWAVSGPGRLARRLRMMALAGGLLLAVHFATWITSLRYLPVSTSVVLVTTAPVWVVVLSRLTTGVRPTREQTYAVALAMLGSAVIGGASLSAGAYSLRGAALALAGAICMGGYLLVAHECQRRMPFLAFIAHVYAAAAAFLWIAMWLTGTPGMGFTASTWAALLGAAVVSQLIGHGGYNWALRRLPPVYVAVVLLGEPVIASALAWWLFAESVAASTWLGGLLIGAGIALGTRAIVPAPTSSA